MSDSTPTNPDHDSAIDAALDAATSKAPPRPASEVPLKKQWDAELEAELEAALEGFDASKFDVATPRTRAADRQHAPKEGRGQESRSGPQTGKVIGVRGKSVFIDLAAKSEGIIPVEQFQGNLPHPGDMIEVVVDHFDTEE